ncbi:fish-egg lectin-like [Salminus brasiliensis]|uniref:fish-egg lectin-like n=1 Tax=Salminus brasiliensis TaxID=930266 RepID=UPI003B835DCF
MERTAVLFVLLNLWTTSQTLECRVVSGSLKQIDAGHSQVYGVDTNNDIFSLSNNCWVQVPGSLKHVSVGPAGIWGVDSDNYIFKLQSGYWVNVRGLLKQVDAGGMNSPAGANMYDDIYCLLWGEGAAWIKIEGKLKYYSCGPYSCWGVNSADDYIMKSVTQTNCAGSLIWEQVPGSLSMIEVSTNGKVYGVNSNGDVLTRDGISRITPAGTGWCQIVYPEKAKHVSL